eukprot:403347267
MRLQKNDIIGVNYEIQRKIGAGSFGQIYQEGFTAIHEFGQEGDVNYMIIDILGPSLEEMLQYCEKKFSLKTTCMLMIQLIKRFSRIHVHNFIHRDIKPENFVLGLANKSGLVHVVDYGLSKRYYSSHLAQHIPHRKDKGLVGTARYASIHAHMGEELSRRDDMEAIGNVMMYFFKGCLPWQNLFGVTNTEKYRKIKEVKCGIQLKKFCEDCPAEFLLYMEHCRQLEFEEKPNYTYLEELFIKICLKEGYDFNDQQYDWVLKIQKIQSWDIFNNKQQQKIIGCTNQKNIQKIELPQSKDLQQMQKDQCNTKTQIQRQEGEDNEVKLQENGQKGLNEKNTIQQQQQLFNLKHQLINNNRHPQNVNKKKSQIQNNKDEETKKENNKLSIQFQNPSIENQRPFILQFIDYNHADSLIKKHIPPRQSFGNIQDPVQQHKQVNRKSQQLKNQLEQWDFAKEKEKLKQEIKILQDKYKNEPQNQKRHKKSDTETIKGEAPGFHQQQRLKIGQTKFPIVNSCLDMIHQVSMKPNNQGRFSPQVQRVSKNDNNSSQGEISHLSDEEFEYQHLDQKSFGAKPSKFQSNPLKNRKKVIVLDDDESEEFQAGISLNIHMSQESLQKAEKINQNGLKQMKIPYNQANNQLEDQLNPGYVEDDEIFNPLNCDFKHRTKSVFPLSSNFNEDSDFSSSSDDNEQSRELKYGTQQISKPFECEDVSYGKQKKLQMPQVKMNFNKRFQKNQLALNSFIHNRRETAFTSNIAQIVQQINQPSRLSNLMQHSQSPSPDNIFPRGHNRGEIMNNPPHNQNNYIQSGQKIFTGMTGLLNINSYNKTQDLIKMNNETIQNNIKDESFQHEEIKNDANFGINQKSIRRNLLEDTKQQEFNGDITRGRTLGYVKPYKSKTQIMNIMHDDALGEDDMNNHEKMKSKKDQYHDDLSKNAKSSHSNSLSSSDSKFSEDSIDKKFDNYQIKKQGGKVGNQKQVLINNEEVKEKQQILSQKIKSKTSKHSKESNSNNHEIQEFRQTYLRQSTQQSKYQNDKKIQRSSTQIPHMVESDQNNKKDQENQQNCIIF